MADHRNSRGQHGTKRHQDGTDTRAFTMRVTNSPDHSLRAASPGRNFSNGHTPSCFASAESLDEPAASPGTDHMQGTSSASQPPLAPRNLSHPHSPTPANATLESSPVTSDYRPSSRAFLAPGDRQARDLSTGSRRNTARDHLLLERFSPICTPYHTSSSPSVYAETSTTYFDSEEDNFSVAETYASCDALSPLTKWNLDQATQEAEEHIRGGKTRSIHQQLHHLDKPKGSVLDQRSDNLADQAESTKLTKSYKPIRQPGLDSFVTNLDDSLDPQIHGLALIITDVPEGYTVGVDNMTPMQFGDSICGVHSIPPGLHFVWVSPDNQTSARSGFWFTSDGGPECRILQWNSYNKTVGPHAVRSEQRFIFQELADYMRCMNPYLYRIPGSGYSVRPDLDEFEASTGKDQHGDHNVPRCLVPERAWYWMTNHINEQLLSRMISPDADEWRIHASDPVRDVCEEHTDLSGSRRFSVAFGGTDLTCSFTKMVGNMRNPNEDRPTDSSRAIIDFLRSRTDLGDDDLIGELQLLFVAGAVLGNDQCLELWWQMAHDVVLRTYKLPRERPLLAQKLLFTLAHQLLYDDCSDKTVLSRFPEGTFRMWKAVVAYKKRSSGHFLSCRDISDRHEAISEAFSAIENWARARCYDSLREGYNMVDREFAQDASYASAEKGEASGSPHQGSNASTSTSDDSTDTAQKPLTANGAPGNASSADRIVKGKRKKRWFFFRRR